MDEWHDFFVASAGAAAALTGLIFVGVSISLARILSFKSLPGRALISLVLLLAILIQSLLFLVPVHSLHTTGMLILVISIFIWGMIARIDYNIFSSKENQYRKLHVFNILLDQLAILPYLAGSVLLLFDKEQAIDWIVVAIVFSFIKAVMDAWVLLVEINR